ncbi:MAG TPA: hypothetical protein VGK45_13430 [Thermoanaerobaculia bacterium]
MPRFTFRLRFTALVLAAALAIPCAAAAAPKTGRQPAGSGVLGQIWLVLTSFWGTGVTPDDGCHWDPSGACISGSAAMPAPAITPDSGCRWDPSGLCLPG